MSFIREQIEFRRTVERKLNLLIVVVIIQTLLFGAMIIPNAYFSKMLFTAWRETRWLELCPMEVNWQSGNIRPEVRALFRRLKSRKEI
jgi:hypothetical protein